MGEVYGPTFVDVQMLLVGIFSSISKDLWETSNPFLSDIPVAISLNVDHICDEQYLWM
jgi:hypothetical protein